MRESESPDFDKCKEEIVDLVLRACSSPMIPIRILSALNNRVTRYVLE